MDKDVIKLTEIYTKELIDLLSDEKESVKIIDQDEEIVYNEIVWDQQNVRLRNQNIILNNSEKQLLILLNRGAGVSEITEVEKLRISDIKKIYQGICIKLCATNQKEAYRRAKELKLL